MVLIETLKRHNSPDVRVVELGFKLFTTWCFDVEHGENASDVKEQISDSERSSWTHPGNGESRQSKNIAFTGNHTACPFRKPGLRDP